MSRHSLNYVDLYPRPLDSLERDPSPLALLAGGALVALLVYCALWVLFSL